MKQKSRRKEHVYYIDQRLKEWGRWYMKCLTQGLGYPEKSTIGQIQEDQGLMSRSTTPPKIPINEDAEEIDTLINELSEYDSNLAHTLRIRYTSQNSLEFEVKRWNIKYTTFKTNLRLAKTWLAARLTK